MVRSSWWLSFLPYLRWGPFFLRKIKEGINPKVWWLWGHQGAALGLVREEQLQSFSCQCLCLWTASSWALRNTVAIEKVGLLGTEPVR